MFKISGKLALLLSTAIPAVIHAAHGREISAIILEPAADRWMYSANSTPGLRSEASTFSALPDDEDLDNRFAQFVFRFDTAAAGIPAGLGAKNYDVSSISLTGTISQDRLFYYDPTPDAWQTYGPMTLADADPGRPVELHGTGFRNGFTAETFQENSPFSSGTPAARNAYAMDFDETGTPRDVTNNVAQGFDPATWAIGQISALLPGDEVPVDSVVTFQPDLSQPGVEKYIREGLNRGAIWFTLSSLHPAIQQGGEFVAYYTKDGPIHQLFGDAAPTLQVSCSLPSGFTAFSRNSSGVVSLEFIGLADSIYNLQASPDLTENSWQTLRTFSPDASGILSYQESSPQPKRFFRIARTISPTP